RRHHDAIHGISHHYLEHAVTRAAKPALDRAVLVAPGTTELKNVVVPECPAAVIRPAQQAFRVRALACLQAHARLKLDLKIAEELALEIARNVLAAPHARQWVAIVRIGRLRERVEFAVLEVANDYFRTEHRRAIATVSVVGATVRVAP